MVKIHAYSRYLVLAVLVVSLTLFLNTAVYAREWDDNDGWSPPPADSGTSTSDTGTSTETGYVPGSGSEVAYTTTTTTTSTSDPISGAAIQTVEKTTSYTNTNTGEVTSTAKVTTTTTSTETGLAGPITTVVENVVNTLVPGTTTTVTTTQPPTSPEGVPTTTTTTTTTTQPPPAPPSSAPPPASSAAPACVPSCSSSCGQGNGCGGSCGSSGLNNVISSCTGCGTARFSDGCGNSWSGPSASCGTCASAGGYCAPGQGSCPLLNCIMTNPDGSNTIVQGGASTVQCLGTLSSCENHPGTGAAINWQCDGATGRLIQTGTSCQATCCSVKK